MTPPTGEYDDDDAVVVADDSVKGPEVLSAGVIGVMRPLDAELRRVGMLLVVEGVALMEGASPDLQTRKTTN